MTFVAGIIIKGSDGRYSQTYRVSFCKDGVNFQFYKEFGNVKVTEQNKYENDKNCWSKSHFFTSAPNVSTEYAHDFDRQFFISSYLLRFAENGTKKMSFNS
jgi:hypothetical protein